eukprot:2340259-Pleurochrysis_carterae.AAC.1
MASASMHTRVHACAWLSHAHARCERARANGPRRMCACGRDEYAHDLASALGGYIHVHAEM